MGVWPEWRAASETLWTPTCGGPGEDETRKRRRSVQQCKRKTWRGDITETKRFFSRNKWSVMLKAAERSSKIGDILAYISDTDMETGG